MATSRAWFSYVRWSIAIAAAVVAAALPIASHLLSGSTLKSCSGAPEGCSPIGATDSLPILVLTVLALWPELSEAGFLGFSMQRRLDAQGRRLDESEVRMAGIEQRLSISQNTTVVISAERILESTKAKRDGESVPGGDAAVDPDLQAEVAAFFKIWGELEPYRRVRPPWRFDSAWAAHRPERPAQAIIDRWQRTFARELEALESAASQLALDPTPLTPDDVRDLTASAALMQVVLEQELERMPPGTFPLRDTERSPGENPAE